MGAFMSTLAEISGYPLILCLILGVAKYFVTLFDEQEWGWHLPDFIGLMAMCVGYVWICMDVEPVQQPDHPSR